MRTKLKLLSVLMLFLATAFTASAYDFEVDGIYYNKTSDTEVAVTYRNTNYNSYSGSVTIPASVTYGGTTYSVTKIGDWAFYYCSGLTSVTIPNSVTKIGDWAFSSCSGLTSVTIPNSVTSIGEDAFYGCSGLTSVTIGNSVTTIGNYAFYKCSSLTSITIPNSVTSIGNSAFYNCYGLTAVHISDLAAWCKINFSSSDANPLYYAHNLYLNGEKVTNLVIPNSVTSIGKYAFRDCSGLNSVTIPNSVTSIGDYAFNGCSSLIKSAYPNHLSNPFSYGISISYDANNSIIEDGFIYNTDKTTLIFAPIDLTSVTIPNSVTSIGYRAFYGCSGLTSVTIPNSVTSIGNSAFYSCSGLTSVTIGSGVTQIGSSAFGNNSIPKVIWLCNTPPSGANNVSAKVNYVSNEQFSISNRKVYPFLSSKFEVDGVVYVPVSPSERTCDVIDCNYAPTTTDIVIDSIVSNKNVQLKVLEVNSYAFYGNDNITGLKIQNSGNIGNQAFYDCDALTTVEASNNGYIGSYAFSSCDALTTVEASNNGYIGSSAFYDCSAITTANLSNKGYIGDQAFYDCDALTTVEASNNGYIGNSAFYDCSAITTANLSNKGYIGNQAFYGCSKLESVTFGSKVSSIGESAFYNCNTLKSLTLPDNISSLGDSSFENCSSLSNVSIGKGISSLPNSVFSGCSSLPSLTIPGNILSIGNYAFSACTQLADVTFEEVNKDSSQISISLGSNGSSPLFASCPLDEVYIGRKLSYKTSSSYGYSPFYRNTSLRSVIISDIETQIYDNEFYGCTNLQEFSCGDGVTTIGKWAFSGCSAMTSFASGSKVESISEEAFSDCTGLTSFTSFAAVPPTCGNQALDDINKWECVLHVPAESISAYQAADQWKEFFFMEGVDDVITDEASGEVVGYYNLQGVRSDEPWDGLNIVVYSDGTRRKIRY